MMARQGVASGPTTLSTTGTRKKTVRVKLPKPKPTWIAVLDDHGNFTEDLDAQMKQWKWRNTQLGYRIVTAFGGKYMYDGKNKCVALDQIFGTDFGEPVRTVEGSVWLCPAKSANIIVMDIEGINMSYYHLSDKDFDRRQEFLRKTVLLSFGLSDVIIFNFWGINVQPLVLESIKPMAQVLPDFHRVSGVREALQSRSLLLFISHYMFAPPPATEIQPIIVDALNEAFKNWPEEAGYTWSDIFDIAVVTSSDVILRDEMAQLSPRFLNEEVEDYYFKPEYNKEIPIDRFALCLESLWHIPTENGVRLPTYGEIRALLRLEITKPIFETDELPQQDVYEVSTEELEKEYVEIGIQVEDTGKNLPPDLDHSFLSLLAKLRGKQPDDPISTVVNVLTVDLFRKLLGVNNYINMASLVSDSDTELLFEFVLYLLEKDHLPTIHLLDANRRVRRLMLKIAAGKPVIPKSLFITDIRVDRSYVGWGGFSDVFRGEFHGRPVAAKLLRTDRHSDICREALTWKSLCHKFVLPFLGIYENQSQLFLISPFMKNGNLAAWRRKSDRSIAEIQKALLEVAEGMQYIHSEGIVHGDLRGTNVLLDTNCQVKIADFGLTRHLEATATQSSSFSPNFAAPELFGNWDDDDDFSDSEEDTKGMQRTHKTDIYAFGSLYYEIHFNVTPFGDLPYVQLMKQVARNRKRPDRLSEPPLSDQAWKLIRRCWRHDASRRPSMEEVLESMMTRNAA